MRGCLRVGDLLRSDCLDTLQWCTTALTPTTAVGLQRREVLGPLRHRWFQAREMPTRYYSNKSHRPYERESDVDSDVVFYNKPSRDGGPVPFLPHEPSPAPPVTELTHPDPEDSLEARLVRPGLKRRTETNGDPEAEQLQEADGVEGAGYSARRELIAYSAI